MGKPEITVRRASADDLAGIIEVASAALGWTSGEPHEQLFRWKHLDNPFGESPMWVAESDGRLAGFRAFMRWELDGPDTGTDAAAGAGAPRRWRAVRAVDTATHPDFQRMGIFSKLTLGALEEMRDEGVDIVFNTPNDQSRPGYLKMGWIDVGRLPVTFRPTSPAALARMARARTAADKWSEPTGTGVSAIDALADRGAVTELVAAASPGSDRAGPDGAGSDRATRPTALSTRLGAGFLAWRYSLEPLHYRAWVGSGGRGDLSEGLVLFRRRRRATAMECSVGHVLVPGGDPGVARRLLGSLAKEVEADYLIRIGAPDARGGFAPLPKQGPRLTARMVTTEPPADLAAWRFQLGDVELF